MRCTASAFFLLLLATGAVAALPLNVSTASGFTKLRSWSNCTLYRVQAASDYEYAPLLVHLTGSRYGEETGGQRGGEGKGGGGAGS